VAHDLPGINPCWVSFIRLFAIKQFLKMAPSFI
jgi:hypothetical protein